MKKLRMAAGALAVAALAATGGLIAAPAWADPPPLTMTAPAEIAAGDQLVITGAGCETPSSIGQARILLDINGELATTFVDPTTRDWAFVTAALKPGTVTVKATCDAYYGSGTYEPITVTVIDKATVALDSSTITPGGQLAVSGAGWGYACDCMAAPIMLTITDGSKSWLLGQSSSPELGIGLTPGWTVDGDEFTAAISLPADIPAGTYTVTATQDGYHSVSTTVTVPRAGGGTGRPAVYLDEPSVVVGGTVTVTISDFDAGETVRIELGNTGVVLATVTADADGTAHAVVTIPADTAPGAQVIVAVGDHGWSPTTNVTVTASPQPSATPTATSTVAPKPSTTAKPGATGSPRLPVTGAEPTVGVAAGAAVIVITGVLVLVARRRAGTRS